jgi:glycogen debranching enzyme
MPIELTVGPPVLTINQGNTFMVTDLNGEIAAESEQGLFSNDTRFVSYYAIFANGYAWQRLSSSTVSYYAARIYLTNPAFETEDGPVEASTLVLTITREVSGSGISENLEVTNYSMKRVRFNLELAIRCDFADIFEVRSHQFVRRGRIQTFWNDQSAELKSSYSNQDFNRYMIYRLLSCGSAAHFANGRIAFELDIPPGGSWHVASRLELILTEQIPNHDEVHIGDDNELLRLQSAWQERATKLISSNEEIYRLFNQSVEDMGALRLYEQECDPDTWMPAAGVPWYVALFGRDSLITSLQNMSINPRFALGALTKLAQYQATEIDDHRDAQPGKILHELRIGELAHFKKIPHTPYYGTADATALYLVTLHETWKWLGDKTILEAHKDTALKCLEWIDKYGDLDGDGFQEYQTRSAQGYENMCWKDSGDSIIYADGSQVKQPKAVCELQGYVFDAWMRMSEVFDALGDSDRASELRKKAAVLYKNFNEKFWCEDLGFFALALDPDKKPVRTIASNAGHCLWSGLASPEHAEKVVKRFQQQDLWSGWGIRTLSSRHPAYNAHSYHRGSVWPHDNGIIALGFKRYGYGVEAAKLARDISEAASHFVSHRLPELYAGIQRQIASFPVQYSGANVPQAWAAGSVFHLLQAILGLQADAPNGKLYVDPTLPKWLPDVLLTDLKVGDSNVKLKFWRDGDRSLWNATVDGGNITIEQKSWQPWDISKV